MRLLTVYKKKYKEKKRNTRKKVVRVQMFQMYYFFNLFLTHFIYLTLPR